MTPTTQFYTLRAITNLHVGSGETNYGVIDKLIERDAASGFPCINSTGLKGAIKQKFADTADLKTVFGSDTQKNNSTKPKTGKKEENTNQGTCMFLSAYLLAMPVRSDKTPYFLATSPALINSFLSLYEDLNSKQYKDHGTLSKIKEYEFKATEQKDACLGLLEKKVAGIIATDDLFLKAIQSLLNTKLPVAIVSDEYMLELTDDLNLPVIARNALEDGQSKNLWYEQVLPRESVMFFPVIWDDVSRLTTYSLTNGILQVGGNASVGYGFTKINEIPNKINTIS